jgi:hypothetical protein
LWTTHYFVLWQTRGTMSKCIPAREVCITLKHKTSGKRRLCSVIVPHYWTKSQLLKYCRQEHPNETVVIEVWMSTSKAENRWETRLWLVNPKELV